MLKAALFSTPLGSARSAGEIHPGNAFVTECASFRAEMSVPLKAEVRLR